MKYVIEHLEPELNEWSIIEYRHISKLVGNGNLIITNVKDSKELEGYAEIKKESINSLKLKNSCVLDPCAKKTLSPDEKFDYFIFGGILGNSPAEGRTKLITLKAERRNLGAAQMPTDNAVMAAKLISEGTPIEKLQFITDLEIKMGENESVVFPFTYIVINNKPLVSKELIEYLKHREDF